MKKLKYLNCEEKKSKTQIVTKLNKPKLGQYLKTQIVLKIKIQIVTTFKN